MAKSVEEALQKIQQSLASTFRDLPAIIGEEAVNFSLEAFDNESWEGESWPARKNPTKWGKPDETDRKLLVKTAKLKRSIRISRVVEDRINLSIGGEDISYARTHNEGFSGKVSQTVDGFVRRGKAGKTIRVKTFTRTINQNIPKRQFVGNSPRLKERIKKIVMNEIFKTLK